MSTNLLFDFTVDKAAKKVFITREFAAELSLVWEALRGTNASRQLLQRTGSTGVGTSQGPGTT